MCRPGGGVRRLERGHDSLVGCARSIVELLQPGVGLSRVRGRRCLRGVGGRAAGCGLAPRGARCRDVSLGPGREGGAGSLRRLRALRAAAVAGRVLERARARGGLRSAARALGGDQGRVLAGGTGGRGRRPLCAARHARPDLLARRRAGCARRARRLVLVHARAFRKRDGARRLSRARGLCSGACAVASRDQPEPAVEQRPCA